MSPHSAPQPVITQAHGPSAVGLSFAPGGSAGPRAVITGVGMVTPLGDSAAQTFERLMAGQYIRTHGRVESLARQGGENTETRGRRYDAVTSLALRAAREAMGSFAPGPRTALVVGTSKGTIDSWLGPAGGQNGGPSQSGSLPMEGLASLATVLSGELGLCGPRLTLSAACASSLHALARAVLMIRAGECERVLVVGAESSFCPLLMASYARLGVFPPEGVGCLPFDEQRAGFLLSEAGVAVLLEREDVARVSGTRVVVDRIAIGTDPTHLTGPDPEGKTLRRLIHEVAGGARVDFVHAHGTGTPANDPVELAAIESALPAGADTPVYSHKGALGHTLGAAGLLSVALSVMFHAAGRIAPNVQTRRPIPTRLRISRDVTALPIARSIAIASGFGGASGAVALSS